MLPLPCPNYNAGERRATLATLLGLLNSRSSRVPRPVTLTTGYAPWTHNSFGSIALVILACKASAKLQLNASTWFNNGASSTRTPPGRFPVPSSFHTSHLKTLKIQLSLKIKASVTQTPPTSIYRPTLSFLNVPWSSLSIT